MDFKKYLRQKKISYLYQIRNDFISDFCFDPGHGAGFSSSDFVHFLHLDRKKYVHKEAYHFVLTNGATYFSNLPNLSNFIINNDQEVIKKIENNYEEILKVLKSNTVRVFPRFLLETNHFLVFDYYVEDEWEKLITLNKEDGAYIYRNFIATSRKSPSIVTPLYNQMAGKVLKNYKTKEIIFSDLKSLEIRDQGISSVLMYNGRVSSLYLLERRFVFKKYLLSPYAIDYPVNSIDLVRLY